MERTAIVGKKEEVKKLTDKLEKAVSFYITDFTGLNANSMNRLRRKFSHNNFDYFVVKNTVLKRASDKLGFEKVLNILDGPNSITISYDDPIGPAKIINDFYKETKHLIVKICYIEGKWFSKEEVTKLASLPSREVLIGKLVYIINSPINQFVCLLRNLLCNFVRVVDEIKKVKEKEVETKELKETKETKEPKGLKETKELNI